MLASQVNKILNMSLFSLHLNPKAYGTHSFRIGSTTDCAAQGASVTQLRFMGHWRSDAYLKYIRPVD